MEIIKEDKKKITVKCAFCKGKGTDPFGVLSKLSFCQVCGGRGEVTINKPAVQCAFCKGTGVYPGQRLTCTVCGGKGAVTVKEPVETCPDCKGDGVRLREDEYLSCTGCNGKGVVTIRSGGR